jgi:hypothetical protein
MFSPFSSARHLGHPRDPFRSRYPIESPRASKLPISKPASQISPLRYVWHPALFVFAVTLPARSCVEVGGMLDERLRDCKDTPANR